MYNMHNTRPHPCTPPYRVSGVNEYLLHVGHSRVLNESSLDMSLKMLNVLVYISLCLVYTVQPLDNNFITCVINIHIYEQGGKVLKRIFNCLCNTNTVQLCFQAIAKISHLNCFPAQCQ